MRPALQAETALGPQGMLQGLAPNHPAPTTLATGPAIFRRGRRDRPSSVESWQHQIGIRFLHGASVNMARNITQV